MERPKIFRRFKNLVAVVIGKREGEEKDLFNCLDVANKKWIFLTQRHTTRVFVVRGKNFSKKIGDGLITKEKDLVLAIRVADCLPIFLFDPKKEIIGLLHAGWRGTIKKISKNGISLFKKLGSLPKEILAYIGPGIGRCCFEVKDDLIKIFSQTFPLFKEKIIIKKMGKYFLDLKETNKLILMREGLKEENIEISFDCTSCNGNYFSFRRDKKLDDENIAIFCQKG